MIKVQDIAYVRFSAPDLDRDGALPERISGSRSPAGATTCCTRARTDPSPYVHVTERGEPGFRGFALEAASAEDLAAAARLDGAVSGVEKIDAPGGGERVRFVDPDGFAVDVVHGREAVAPLETRCSSPLNMGEDRPRRGKLQRIAAGPACVKRIGHCVVRVADFRRSQEWYTSRFGFLASDEVYLGDEDNIVTSFMRCDRGDDFTDHHTLLCVGLGEVGFDHAAFEVEDFDSLMVGHDHLKKGEYEHHAGVGRHVLGSQIFDYWRDPWGHVVEHFTDGDLLNASHVTERHDPATALGTQWGEFGPPV